MLVGLPLVAHNTAAAVAVALRQSVETVRQTRAAVVVVAPAQTLPAHQRHTPEAAEVQCDQAQVALVERAAVVMALCLAADQTARLTLAAVVGVVDRPAAPVVMAAVAS
jgi:hypothetical protein